LQILEGSEVDDKEKKTWLETTEMSKTFSDVVTQENSNRLLTGSKTSLKFNEFFQLLLAKTVMLDTYQKRSDKSKRDIQSNNQQVNQHRKGNNRQNSQGNSNKSFKVTNGQDQIWS
jgi:hypothetical protein